MLARVEKSPDEKDREIRSLKRRCRDLENQVLALRDGLTVDSDLPVEWGLTFYECRFFSALLKKKFVSRESVMSAIYFDRPNDWPDEKTIDAHLCHMRKKLKPYGIVIYTVWGRGFALENREDLARAA